LKFLALEEASRLFGKRLLLCLKRRKPVQHLLLQCQLLHCHVLAHGGHFRTKLCDLLVRRVS
jgi:hypothetical protein